jgi:hypothetical protein
MIDTLRGGSAIFAYYPDPKWLSRSAFVGRPSGAAAKVASAAAR